MAPLGDSSSYQMPYQVGFNETSSNDSVVTESEAERRGLGETVILAVVLTLLVAATIIGNSLVVYAVIHIRTLRSVTNYFIVSLAVSDLGLGVMVLPMSSTYEILRHWVFGHYMCVFWCAIDVMCCTASILNLVAISVDRYLAINKPMRYPNISTTKRALIAIAAVWTLSVLISVPPVFGWRNERMDPDQCELTSGKGYVIYSSLGSFFIPLVVMLVVYSRIYTTAARQTKKIKAGSSLGSVRGNGYKAESAVNGGSWKESALLYIQRKASRNSSSSTSHEGAIRDVKKRSKTTVSKRLRKFAKEKKAAKTLAIVVGVFILCWFPFFSCYLLREVCKSCNISDSLFKVFFWLGYCNSFLNPVIYPCLNRDFRRAFGKLLCRSCFVKPELPYYDLPTRSVKPIRASRRLRLSVVPNSSSSGTPPDSPNVFLLRKQKEMHKMSKVLEFSDCEGAAVYTNIQAHLGRTSRAQTRLYTRCSARSRVRGSFSAPDIDAAADEPSPYFMVSNRLLLSRTSDCLQLLTSDSGADEPEAPPGDWSHELESLLTDSGQCEMIAMSAEDSLLIKNRHAEEPLGDKTDHEDISHIVNTTRKSAQPHSSIITSPPESDPPYRSQLIAMTKYTGNSWPSFDKHQYYYPGSAGSVQHMCSAGDLSDKQFSTSKLFHSDIQEPETSRAQQTTIGPGKPCHVRDTATQTAETLYVAGNKGNALQTEVLAYLKKCKGANPKHSWTI